MRNIHALAAGVAEYLLGEVVQVEARMEPRREAQPCQQLHVGTVSRQDRAKPTVRQKKSSTLGVVELTPQSRALPGSALLARVCLPAER